MTIRHIEFDIKGRDQTKQAWDSAGRQAKAFNNVLDRTSKSVANYSKGFRDSAGAAKLSNQQLQNMSFQLNDMAVMLASGQSPFTLIMQQGMQIGQMFGPGSTVQSALRATGVGLMNFVTNPINLAIVATALLASGAERMFDAFTSSGADEAEGTLKRHSEWIESLENGYEKAAKAAKEYQDRANQLPRSLQIVAGQELQDDLANALAEAKQATIEYLYILENRGPKALHGMTGRFQELLRGFDSGQLKARELQEQLAKIRLDQDLPEYVREFARRLSDSVESAAQLEAGLRSAEAAGRSLAAINFSSLGGLAGIEQAIKGLRSLTPELLTARERVEALYETGSNNARSIGEVQALTTAYEVATAALDEQARREAAIEAEREARSKARADRRKAESAAKRAAAKAEREASQFARGQVYLEDLAREVEILGLSTNQRTAQLKVLKEERTVRAAIAGLGPGATEEQIALVRELIPERERLKEVNRAEAEQLKIINGQYNQMGSIIGSSISGAIKGTEDLEDAALRLALAFAEAALQASLIESFGKDSKETSFFSSIFSGLFSGFSSGGYTGGGDRNRRTGFVHGQEFVAHAAATQKYRPELEAMNRGTFQPNVVQNFVWDPPVTSGGGGSSQSGSSQKSIVEHVHKVVVESNDEKFTAKVVELSAQVVNALRGDIVSQAVGASQSALATGAMDGAMSRRYGQSPQAIVR